MACASSLPKAESPSQNNEELHKLSQKCQVEAVFPLVIPSFPSTAFVEHVIADHNNHTAKQERKSHALDMEDELCK